MDHDLINSRYSPPHGSRWPIVDISAMWLPGTGTASAFLNPKIWTVTRAAKTEHQRGVEAWQKAPFGSPGFRENRVPFWTNHRASLKEKRAGRGDLKWLFKSHVMHLICTTVPIANIWAWLSEGGTQSLASRHFSHYHE